MRPLIERLWRNDLPLAYWPLWMALTPLAAVYASAVTMRARYWRSMARDAGLPAVSVGNLTVGGNGKTPFTLFLASRLLQRGLRVGIASRGYGRHSKSGKTILVSDGRRILTDVFEAGEEPMMMAKRFAGPVGVARRRIDAIRLLIAQNPLDVVVLDDGFQHLQLRRDLNLLLLSGARGMGNGWVLPAGPLREPRNAIARADVIILLSSLGLPETRALPAEVLAFASRPMIRANLRPRALVHSERGTWRESSLEIKGRRVLAVSGLADPSGFHAMIGALGADIAGALDYPDHYDYGPADWENILAAAQGTDLVLTTEKDLVKLERFSRAGVDLLALGLEVEMEHKDEARLIEMVIHCVRKRGNLSGPCPVA